MSYTPSYKAMLISQSIGSNWYIKVFGWTTNETGCKSLKKSKQTNDLHNNKLVLYESNALNQSSYHNYNV